MNLKHITFLSITVIAVSGCGERYSPDELTVLKYKPLVIPEKLVLVEPKKGKKSLGYIEPRDVIANETLAYAVGKDGDILKKFNIKNVDESIRDKLSKPEKTTKLLDIKKEQKRIKDNLAQGKSVTDGETPSIETKYLKAGIDELFGDD